MNALAFLGLALAVLALALAFASLDNTDDR